MKTVVLFWVTCLTISSGQHFRKRDFVAEGFFARHEGHHEPNYGIAAVNSDKKPDERGSRYDSGEYYGYRQDKNSPSSSSRSGYTKNVKLQQAKDRYGFGNLLDGYGAPDYSYAYGYSFGEPYGYEEYTLDPRILKGKRSAYLWWDDDYKIREKEYIPVEYRPEYGLSDYEAFDNYYHDYDTNYDLDYDYDDPGYYQDYDYEDPADYEESDLEYDDYDESDSEYSDDYDESDYDSYNDEYDDDDVDYDADQDIAYDEYIPADYDYGSGWVEVTNGGEELNEGYEPIGDEYASYSDEYRDQDQNGWPFRKKFSRKPY